MPFLDTQLVRTPSGTIDTKVYRKKTHTDQFLNYDSHHPIEHKRSVVNTLLHRSEIIMKQQRDKKEEDHHVREALRVNG